MSDREHVDPKDASPDPIHWVAALEGLADGDLGIFADYLDGPSNGLDPWISRYLVKLIRGSNRESGWRLQLIPHPDLQSHQAGRERRMRASQLDLKMAFFIAQHDGFSRARGQRAYQLASEKFHLSPNYIRKRVQKFRTIALRKGEFLKAIKLS